MRFRTRTVAIVGTTAVGLVAAGGVAVATGAVDPGGDDLLRPGTVTVDESALPDDDVAEQAALAELSSVEDAAARAAAVEELGGGEIVESELEDEDGFVVWEVAVRAEDGVVHEVTVDAGDAGILGTEIDDDDTDDDDDDRDDADDDTDD